MSLNVNRNVQDQFYRYKMPRLMAKVEGKGNGVKTVLPNMVEIARALGRPPTYPTKYFGCELGAQTQFDFKNDRYIVNGSHDAAKLQDMLDGFIKKFVLCEQCDNPETVYKVNVKKAVIGSTCKACGYIYMLDMRHKLTTFIIKNPPDMKLDSHGTSLTEKKGKKSQSKKDGDDAENGNGDASISGAQDDDDDEWANDWGDDTSDAAVKKRMEDLTSGVKNLAMDNDLEKPEAERINIFHDFVKAKIAGDSLSSVDKEIHTESERLEITAKAPIVLCELLLNDEKIIAAIKKNKRLFLRFCAGNQKAQKYLMGGIEKTVESRKADLLPKVPMVLKAFYDEDILDEEVLIDWSKKVSKKYVSKELSEQIHKKAEKFIQWLKEADEESSEDDEDEVELEFDERAKISSIKEKTATPPPAGPAAAADDNGEGKDEDGEEGEEDLDIDDI
jgi:translation initiation factor 5